MVFVFASLATSTAAMPPFASTNATTEGAIHRAVPPLPSASFFFEGKASTRNVSNRASRRRLPCTLRFSDAAS